MECVEFLAQQPRFAVLGVMFRASLSLGLKLNVGNANPGNIGSDFSRFGIEFWQRVHGRDRRNRVRQQRLEHLHRWRNAVAHQDFTNPTLGGRDDLRISEVRAWRSVCERLALEFDTVMRVYLQSLTGVSPW